VVCQILARVQCFKIIYYFITLIYKLYLLYPAGGYLL